jgi:hypothetical protein
MLEGQTISIWPNISNIHILSAEGNFKEGLKDVKPLLTKDHTTCIGYVDSRDRMANSYSISKRTCKWMKKFFHLLHLTILNSYIVYKSCGGNVTIENLGSNRLGTSLCVKESSQQFTDSNEPTLIKIFCALAR